MSAQPDYDAAEQFLNLREQTASDIERAIDAACAPVIAERDKLWDARDELLEERYRYKKALERIVLELGVPGEGYPAPVVHAANMAREALKGADDAE